MTRVVSTKSNAPFKRYVRANRRKIGLVVDVRDATRFNNHYELLKVLARVHSILPSCYFEYEELVPPADNDERQSSAFSGHYSATLPERAGPSRAARTTALI